MLWVADTGPLLHLHQAGLLDLLQYEGKTLTTPSVLEEWLRKTRGGKLPEWVRLEMPGQRALGLALDWTRRGVLDAGEAEALAHALEIGAEGFLTDDTAAREFARAKGLAVRGTLGVILIAAAHDALKDDAARAALQNLCRTSTLWISQALRRESTQALERILAKRREEK